MAAPWESKKPPKLLRATYLADQEYLLEETRATKLLYFPGPVLWTAVFALLSYLTWAPRYHLPHLAVYTDALARAASFVHLASSTLSFYLGIFFDVLVLAGAIWIAVRYVRWIRTVYAVTSHRVIIQRGIIGRDFDEIPVTQVRGVDVNQTIGQRLLGYGTVRVSSEGGGHLGNESWRGIPKPFLFQRLVETAAERIQTPGASASPPPR